MRTLAQPSRLPQCAVLQDLVLVFSVLLPLRAYLPVPHANRLDYFAVGLLKTHRLIFVNPLSSRSGFISLTVISWLLWAA